jgi:hypothetical protein
VSDAVTSISAGIFQNLGIAAIPAMALLNTVPYDYINKHYALIRVPMDSAVQWIVAVGTSARPWGRGGGYSGSCLP